MKDSPDITDQQVEEVLKRLKQSSFRRRFKLKGKELDYLREKKMKMVMRHAAGFVNKRLAPAHPKNDGKQTPMKNHPVFIAQHATATCCRKCLEKWHGIAQGRELNAQEKEYIIRLIRAWLERWC